MTLKLTPEVLAGAYEYLCLCEPFCRWNLPDSEDITFRVTRHRDRMAHYCRQGTKTEIVVSSAYIGRTESLMTTMAHEMIHLHQALVGMENAAQHNAAFRKIADHVCEIHGFDPLLF